MGTSLDADNFNIEGKIQMYRSILGGDHHQAIKNMAGMAQTSGINGSTEINGWKIFALNHPVPFMTHTRHTPTNCGVNKVNSP